MPVRVRPWAPTESTPGVPHDAGVAAARERAAAYRESELSDAADKALAERALLVELGTADFVQGRRMLAKHLADMPADKRARIEQATVAGGVFALHDPTILKALGVQALGPLPTSAEEVEREIVAARKRMRDEPRSWFADDRAQLRYRTLPNALGSKSRGG